MIEEFLAESRELPDTIYHYTNLNGFMGIVQNKCIWASDWQYMNDPAESHYWSPMILEALWDRLSNVNIKFSADLLNVASQLG